MRANDQVEKPMCQWPRTLLGGLVIMWMYEDLVLLWVMVYYKLRIFDCDQFFAKNAAIFDMNIRGEN